MPSHCDECGGLLSEPGLFGCDDQPHPKRDLAQRIAGDIEEDLRDRSGLGWDGIDEDTCYAIRHAWAAIVRKHLSE